MDWRQRVITDLATVRGLRLTVEDRLRRELLQQLYGHGVIRPHTLECVFGIRFSDYFAEELERLTELEQDGLVKVEPEQIRLTVPLGRLLVRVVAAVFDRYLPPWAYRAGLPAELAWRGG